jgi:hypothetical protein
MSFDFVMLFFDDYLCVSGSLAKKLILPQVHPAAERRNLRENIQCGG